MAYDQKIRWTESEVLNLPANEHDFFDRKRGDWVFNSSFRSDLAKALSAFANSGGGALIIGVCDDGNVDGVQPVRSGRTKTRDYIEQIIPTLTDSPITAFRVHEVERDSPSQIPDDRQILVVEVGDSLHAPHQVKEPADSMVYYYRAGGRSKPAPHFYLEALRKRLIEPIISCSNVRVTPCTCLETHQGIVVTFAVGFQVSNQGRVATSKWVVALESAELRNYNNSTVYFSDYPRGVFQKRVGLIPREKTLYPGYRREESATFGALFPAGVEKEALLAALQEISNNPPLIRLQPYCEFPQSPAQPFLLPMPDPGLMASHINFLHSPELSPTYGTQQIERELVVHRLEANMERSDRIELKFGLENKSIVNYSELELVIHLLDEHDQVVANKEITIRHFPPSGRQYISETFYLTAVISDFRFQFFVKDCEGRYGNGPKFGGILECGFEHRRAFFGEQTSESP